MGKYLSALKRLSGWFDRQKRVLPWRDQPTLYRVWVSEIMLQQTQVATVIPYFERFMARFPTVEVLSAAGQDDVLLNWAGLGYYSRARNLHKGAQTIVSRGEFPKSRDEWLDIPGVGPYTAGAILSIALDKVEPILDGNVERVLSRVYRVGRQEGDDAFKKRLWQLAEAFVTDGDAEGIPPSVLNQAMMELGATVCSPRKPRCGRCPLAEICEGRAQGDAEEFPPRKAPKKWLEVREELHCLLDENDQVLVRKRANGEWRAGLWDLLEDKPAARKVESLGKVETKHTVTRHKIVRTTHIWRLKNKPWAAAEADDSELRWIPMEEPEVAVGSALRKTLQQVRRSLLSLPFH